MEIKKYLCDVCNKEYPDKEKLLYKIMIYHGAIPLIFNDVCSSCVSKTIDELIKIKENVGAKSV